MSEGTGKNRSLRNMLLESIIGTAHRVSRRSATNA